MTFIKRLSAIFAVALFVCSANAQRPDDVLATSSVTSYKVSILSPKGQEVYQDRRNIILETRTRLLNAMISAVLLQIESKAVGVSEDKLIADAKAKIPEPSAAEIQKLYDANRAALGTRSLEESKPQILDFLKHEAEDKAIEVFLTTLRAKHKVTAGKDVNTVALGPSEVLATIGTRTITLRDFDQEHKVRINDIENEIYEELRADLEVAIFTALVNDEAKARNLDTSSFIASEITDKLRQFTDDERAVVEMDLMQRLFTKYNVKILLPEPPALVQNVSVDDDPFIGNSTAAVTVVMFTDFQCPTCARVHPMMKQLATHYGAKIRIAVRDFPLEGIHAEAFGAALAANAARAQGKFTEYSDVLYRNQEALDKVSLVKYATELGLNVKQFELDFSDAKAAAEVRKDQADGRSYGVAGTPTVFVNGVKVHRLSLSGFRSAIDRALKK